jgi:uncharacterized protein (TIGR03000 family)
MFWRTFLLSAAALSVGLFGFAAPAQAARFGGHAAIGHAAFHGGRGFVGRGAAFHRGWGRAGWARAGWGRGWYGRGWYRPYYGLGLGYGLGLASLYTPYYGYYPYYNSYYPYYDYSYPYYDYDYYPNYDYTSGFSVVPQGYYSSYYYPSETTASVTPSAAATRPVNDNCAHLEIMVPPDAQLWFNGIPTTESGADRTFVSPPLTPGQNYSYDITARWVDNGQPVQEHRSIHVHANQWSSIDLTVPAPATVTQTRPAPTTATQPAPAAVTRPAPSKTTPPPPPKTPEPR